MASTIAGTADEAHNMRQKLMDCAMQFADAGDEKADISELSALAQLVRNRDADADAAIAAGSANVVRCVHIADAVEGAMAFDVASKKWSKCAVPPPLMITRALDISLKRERVFDGGDVVIISCMVGGVSTMDKKTCEITKARGSPHGGICCGDGKYVYTAGYVGNGNLLKRWDGDRWESFVHLPFNPELSGMACAGGYVYFIGRGASYRVNTVNRKIEWLDRVRHDIGNVSTVVALDQIRLMIFDRTSACSILNTVTWEEERIIMLPRGMGSHIRFALTDQV